jgi:hypothetical protein
MSETMAVRKDLHGSAYADLVAGFLDGTLSKAQWTHQAHLIVGAWHVHHHGAAAALDHLRTRIKRLNDHHGTVNSPTSGYHETITRAYVAILAAYLRECDAKALDQAITRLLASPLADNKVLLAYYSADLLFSARARLEWAAPDLTPLP